MFRKRDNIKEVEEGEVFGSPKFNENGLIPVIISRF